MFILNKETCSSIEYTGETWMHINNDMGMVSVSLNKLEFNQFLDWLQMLLTTTLSINYSNTDHTIGKYKFYSEGPSENKFNIIISHDGLVIVFVISRPQIRKMVKHFILPLLNLYKIYQFSPLLFYNQNY